jgi:fumarate hydratase subunit beta
MTGQETIYIETPLTRDMLNVLHTGDQVQIFGVIYTARDAAHERMSQAMQQGRQLPFDPEGQIIFYVGPTPPPPGRVIGSAGPTTASRMDPFTPMLIERGLKGMIGKGRRSEKVRQTAMAHGCVYFGSVEGTAALLSGCIQHAEVVAYDDLGPEAIYRLTVAGFPAIVVNDLHGRDLYEDGHHLYRRLWKA